MILTGDPVLAEEAEKIGLVTKVFPDEDVEKSAIELGREINGNCD